MPSNGSPAIPPGNQIPTNSLDFPGRSAYQGRQGDVDLFVSKLSPAGDRLIYSTYLGGSGAEGDGSAVGLDQAGNVYVAGATTSIDFPTESALDPQHAGGESDIFVTKFSPGGDLLFSTGADTLVRPTDVSDHASGIGRGFVETTDDWLAPDKSVVCRDRRRFEVFAEADFRGIDLGVTLLATEKGLALGDTKEGTMPLRLAPGLTVDGSDGKARLVNSEGLENAAAWGKRARWVLASGLVDGKPAALAMMDHPQNLRHPTTWHARTYGLLAANPFGLSDFEGAPKGTGDLVLPPDGSLRLRYRLLFFAGVPSKERLDALFADFAAR